MNTPRYAGGGQINLQGTIDMGGGGGGQFGQAGDNGYKAAGSGSAGQFGNQMMASPAVMPSSNPFGGQMGGGMGGYDLRQLQESGYDPRAVAANPQGFRQQLAEQQRRLQSMGQAESMMQGPRKPPPLTRMPTMSAQVEPQMLAAVMPQQYDSFSIMSLPTSRFANGGMTQFAQGGPSHLGDYSDGGRLLRGPGDGVSDSIPASIGDKRPARLADGEFVVPARIVSELGNGSTEAGARKLYAMMDRVQKARKKSIGKNRVAVNSRSEKMLPA
jgi:hypothetical protein